MSTEVRIENLHVWCMSTCESVLFIYLIIWVPRVDYAIVSCASNLQSRVSNLTSLDTKLFEGSANVHTLKLRLEGSFQRANKFNCEIKHVSVRQLRQLQKRKLEFIQIFKVWWLSTLR